MKILLFVAWISGINLTSNPNEVIYTVKIRTDDSSSIHWTLVTREPEWKCLGDTVKILP